MKGHLNDILKFEASPYEVSWNLMKGKLDIGEWSWIINTCWWVWLSFKFQNFTAPFSEKVNAHLPLINTDKFCEINLSEKSFQAILQCSEKKKKFWLQFSLTIMLCEIPNRELQSNLIFWVIIPFFIHT